jgi:hypothetical protein
MVPVTARPTRRPEAICSKKPIRAGFQVVGLSVVVSGAVRRFVSRPFILAEGGEASVLVQKLVIISFVAGGGVTDGHTALMCRIKLAD